jgi:hypothetical protein
VNKRMQKKLDKAFELAKCTVGHYDDRGDMWLNCRNFFEAGFEAALEVATPKTAKSKG